MRRSSRPAKPVDTPAGSARRAEAVGHSPPKVSEIAFESLATPSPATLEATKTEFERLKSLGAEETRAWTSALFYNDEGIRKMFAHKLFGLKKPSYRKQISNASLVFVGSGAKQRAVQRTDRDHFVFAHDHPKVTTAGEFREFGGEKLFMTLSPWQLLASFTDMPQERQDSAWRCFKDGKIAGKFALQKGGRDDLVENGQRIVSPPMSSLFVERGAGFGEGCYVFNLDIDGKVCMSPEALARRDEIEASEVKRRFEQADDSGTVPRLAQISALVRRTMCECFGDECKVHVSWHRSLGWKPSWRGYALGPLFASIDVARAYYENVLHPEVVKKSWYVKGLLDHHSYHKGVDRCLGSAKFETAPQSEFRFLSPGLIDEVSDRACRDMMRSCPNEYVLRCLGLLYPRNWDGALLRATAGLCAREVEGDKRRKAATTTGVSKRAKVGKDDVFVKAVRKALSAGGYAREWSGRVETSAHEENCTKIFLRADEPHAFCIFKHKRGERHASVRDKIVFEIRVPDTAFEVPELLQRCWSCEHSRAERVAWFDAEHAKLFRETLSAKTGDGKRSETDHADLKKFALRFDYGGGAPPFAISTLVCDYEKGVGPFVTIAVTFHVITRRRFCVLIFFSTRYFSTVSRLLGVPPVLSLFFGKIF